LECGTQWTVCMGCYNSHVNSTYGYLRTQNSTHSHKIDRGSKRGAQLIFPTEAQLEHSTRVTASTLSPCTTSLPPTTGGSPAFGQCTVGVLSPMPIFSRRWPMWRSVPTGSSSGNACLRRDAQSKLRCEPLSPASS